tara:strand:- start:401 stop:793 length:393 start_codon:yes stop_codon:yes gene_type:complete
MIADTSFIIDLMRKNKAAELKLKELIKKGETPFLTSITLFEIFTGLERTSKPENEKAKIRDTLNKQIVFPLDSRAAEKAGEIDGKLIKEGNMIGSLDCMIAGIALIKKEKVLTRNLKDFQRIPGLEVDSY